MWGFDLFIVFMVFLSFMGIKLGLVLWVKLFIGKFLNVCVGILIGGIVWVFILGIEDSEKLLLFIVIFLIFGVIKCWIVLLDGNLFRLWFSSKDLRFVFGWGILVLVVM